MGHIAEIFCGTELEPKIKDSLQIINKSIDDYGVNGISLSFNGGKDCTVILYLLRYVLQTRGYGQVQIRTLFIKQGHN